MLRVSQAVNWNGRQGLCEEIINISTHLFVRRPIELKTRCTPCELESTINSDLTGRIMHIDIFFVLFIEGFSIDHFHLCIKQNYKTGMVRRCSHDIRGRGRVRYMCP